MNMIKTIFLLLACFTTGLANNTTDKVRYVFSFNPTEVNCDGFDIGDYIDTGINIPSNIPFFGNQTLCRPREDDESAFDFFRDLVEGIASLFGFEQEPVFDFSIVTDVLEISVRVMLPDFARLLARLPFMGPVVQDERRFLNLPSTNEDFSPYDGEILTYGLQMVGALDVDTTGSVPRKVCIIDSGYSLGHVDLPSDVDGLDGGEQGPWDNDGHGHGTHVAGTIAAIGGNTQGVVGVAGNGVELFIVKALGDEESTWVSDFMRYVQACADNGANVVSMSLGGPTYFQYEDEGYQALYDQGILFVAAAGNDGASTYSYPASYSSVISVAAVDRYKNVADFSQFNDKVELSGPGVEILSTLPDNYYGFADGTSMACPHVSGVAALVWSVYPDKTNKEIRAALDLSAEDLGVSGWDVDHGFGLVRADLAVEYLANNPNPVQPEFGTTDPSGGLDGECADDPADWVDIDGDGCDVYLELELCDLYGGWYPGSDGLVAQQACCVCGGGSFTCDNESDWVDSDGDGCDFYAQDDNCLLYGNSFENEGQTASTACCACQGITATSITSTTKSGFRPADNGTVATNDEYLDKNGNVVSVPTSASISTGMRLVMFMVVLASALLA